LIKAAKMAHHARIAVSYGVTGINPADIKVTERNGMQTALLLLS